MSSSSTTANARLQHSDDPVAEAHALIEQRRAGEAVSLLKKWIAADRGGLLVRLSLARALMESGDSAGALETARETSLLYSNAADAIVGLGEALLRVGHLTTAIPEFQRAMRLDPENGRAQFLLGCAWLEAGEAEKALAVFEACASSPETEAKISEARAMLARPRSDPRYVRHLFDQFSADYDQRMIEQLSYRAPQILNQLAGLVMPGRQELRILDLGCGTGLTGEAFEEMASQLDGIDLSPAMIERARARRIYDELAVSDLETFLVESNRQYDLILAADTLVYLGDLARVFPGAARQLAPDGFFLFTVEKKDGEGFELGPKRHWRHSENYLTALAFQSGLSVAGILECVPRMEANRAVDGFAVALMRGNG